MRAPIAIIAKVVIVAVTALCVAFLQMLEGCARREPNRIAHHPPPADTKSVFVIGHRYHTGLAVRARDVSWAAWPARRDFPDADYLKLGWGEREYYTRENPGLLLALRALFIPSSSAIEAIAVSGQIAAALSDSEIIELRVPHSDFRRMTEFIRETHEFDEYGEAVVITVPGDERRIYYAAVGTFDALHNCNVWVAHALRVAGFPVRPATAITTGLLLDQVRPLSVVRPGSG